ncbi:SO_0444 family Cu/Zn efflux transporter [Pseudoalteromonas sp. Of7M-16]|uniref:SO_0444 family Cu/Zn efflux transporter n=1 Tax=Pseudoalteromonas sp. Of7M-16 TaxID=2917756 RepID=UPI001EF3D62A|nr:SO_0444 family Cu/Zn efflux transporter [Pseudoalteromonas sp. Of7M-16]MCG7546668.1 SO_0444 family Cu/Zn efflux transporter [Pseudoalteromonas sp. Of7M-16]
MTLISNFWQLFVISAPWLMLGLLLAGLLNVFIPKDFLQRHLGKEGLWTTVKAALIGAPMPLCSCGVIPAAIGLRRAGGSKSATTAFLVSTPETGVDSISVSYAMLGPFMAVIRPIAAVASAITAGLLVGRDSTELSGNAQHCDKQPQATSCCSKALQATPKPQVSCCSQEQGAVAEAAPVCAEQVSEPVTTCCSTESSPTKQLGAHSHEHIEQDHQTNCCSREDKIDQSEVSACCSSQSKPKDGLPTKLWQAVKFSCNKLLSDTMVWLLIGIFFAALVQTYVPTEFLAQWGNGILAMIVVILISIPMYICATASTPIAAGLLLAGVSPGAVLVFMLAGPATNVATIGVVAKELGRRAVAAYITAVIGVAILFGFLTDYLVLQFGFEVAAMAGHQHEVLPSWLSQVCAILLAVLMLRLFAKDFKQRLTT